MNSACAEASLPIVKVNPSTILRNYIGDSNFALKAVFSLAEKLQPCVIFIDDIDVLLGSRSHYDALRHSELKSECSYISSSFSLQMNLNIDINILIYS